MFRRVNLDLYFIGQGQFLARHRQDLLGELYLVDVRLKILMMFKMCMRNTTSRIVKAFDMSVMAYDPYVTNEDFVQNGVQKVDWDELVETSDILSIHLPLTETTRHWIGSNAFQKMKPTAYVIHTARGAVMDTEALVEALTEGWIAGAGLDVLEQQPLPVDHPLLNL